MVGSRIAGARPGIRWASLGCGAQGLRLEVQYRIYTERSRVSRSLHDVSYAKWRSNPAGREYSWRL